jgi:hypothetical protein
VWRIREPRPIDVNAEALVDLTNGHVIEFDYVLHWGSVTSLRLSPTPDVREQPVRQFDRWLRVVRLVFADREPMEFPGFQIDPRCPSIGSNDAVQIAPALVPVKRPTRVNLARWSTGRLLVVTC